LKFSFNLGEAKILKFSLKKKQLKLKFQVVVGEIKILICPATASSDSRHILERWVVFNSKERHFGDLHFTVKVLE